MEIWAEKYISFQVHPAPSHHAQDLEPNSCSEIYSLVIPYVVHQHMQCHI